MAAWLYWPPFSRMPGRIALDVAGIARRPVEGRREQQRQAVVAPDQLLVDATPSPCAARAGSAAPGEHGPGLRDRVDPAFVARRRAERRAVVEGSRAGTSRRPRPRARAPRAADVGMGAPASARVRARACLGERREQARASRSRNQPSQTLSPLPALADAVHAVVPVAGADQRQAVRAGQREALVEPAGAVLEQRCRARPRPSAGRRRRARRAPAPGLRGTARSRRAPRRRRSPST